MFYVTPASVVDYIAPTPVVNDVPAPVGEYISPAPGVHAAPVPVFEYIALAPAVMHLHLSLSTSRLRQV